MSRLTIVYHNDGTKTVGGRASVHGYDDSERLMIDGTQGERVLRGYRELEAKGELRRDRMNDHPDKVKRIWQEEITSRFK